MVHYGLNKIKLAFDTQYEIVIPTLPTYLPSGLGLGNAGVEPTTAVSERWLTRVSHPPALNEHSLVETCAISWTLSTTDDLECLN